MDEQMKTIKIEHTEHKPMILAVDDHNLHIYVDDHVDSTIYQIIESGIHHNMELELKKGSKLELFTYNTGSSEGLFETNLTVHLQENSEFTLYNLISKNSSNNTKQSINLNGAKATAVLYNYIIATETIKVKTEVVIRHHVGDTVSKIENNAIANNGSKINCDNDTIIVKGSKASNAYQKTRGLTIGDESVINVRPILHIDEFDVLAGHGASIGSLSKDDLFYLMSRGLTKAEAEKLAVFGMVKPLIDQIKSDIFRERITTDLESKLK